MKILVFGGHGMAGHMVKDYLVKFSEHEVWYTVRRQADETKCIALDITDDAKVLSVLCEIRPDVMINTIGLLNENAARSIQEGIYVNSLFPHKLAQYGVRNGCKLIHISTDCVFSGNRGKYIETDTPDGQTVYARTKSLGEVAYGDHLTIRTSIIGPELKTSGIGLFHWFMNQSGKIRGYRETLWNGVTTLELAKAIEWTLHQDITGLVHLAAPETLSKFTLLNLLKDVFQRHNLQIEADDTMKSDRSLVNTRSDFHYTVGKYPVMLQEMKDWMNSRMREYYPYHYV